TGALASANVPQITVGTNSLTGTTPTLTLATQADGVGNEVQTVVLGGTSVGGTYTLTFAGQTTGNINPTDSDATVQSALQGLSTIGSGNVTVLGSSGGSGGTYLVVFTGQLASANVPQITVGTNALTGTTPTLTTGTNGYDGVGNEVQQIVFGGTGLGGSLALRFARQAASG